MAFCVTNLRLSIFDRWGNRPRKTDCHFGECFRRDVLGSKVNSRRGRPILRGDPRVPFTCVISERRICTDHNDIGARVRDPVCVNRGVDYNSLCRYIMETLPIDLSLVVAMRRRKWNDSKWMSSVRDGDVIANTRCRRWRLHTLWSLTDCWWTLRPARRC